MNYLHSCATAVIRISKRKADADALVFGLEQQYNPRMSESFLLKSLLPLLTPLLVLAH